MSTERQTLIGQMKAAHSDFMRAADRITEQQATVPNLLGNWSAKDILAHLVNWQTKALEVVEGARDGRTIEQPADDDEFNAQSVERYRAWTWEETKMQLERSAQNLIQLARTLPDATWSHPDSNWLLGSTIYHYPTHQPDIEQAAERS